jgi:FkbM family methyltransferase
MAARRSGSERGLAVSLKSGFRLMKRRTLSLLGLDVWQLPQVRVATARLGDPGGRWSIATDGLGPSTVVWALGVGTDVSFERDLIARYGVTVHAFDPTPLSIEWAARQRLPDRFHFHHYGVADFDGVARFAPPRKRKFASFSMVRGGGVGSPVDSPVHRLATLREMLRLPPPDVLKMDIEGAEFPVLADLMAGDMRPAQILVEFHHRWREVGAGRTRAAIAQLGRHGYRVAAVAPNGLEYTFILAGGTRSGAR